MKKYLTDLVVEACQVLKSKDADKFAPVIALLMAKEKAERTESRRTGKRKKTLFDKRGHKIELFAEDVKRMTK